MSILDRLSTAEFHRPKRSKRGIDHLDRQICCGAWRKNQEADEA